MTRYLIILITTFVALIGAWVGLFQLQVGAPTETSRFVHECLEVKHSAVEALEGPKGIVMSGSSGFYGLRAEALGEVLGRPMVNMGVHAGLGLDFLIHQTQQVVGRGDLVVMSLEYEHYWDEGQINNVLLDYVVARDVAYFRSLGLVERAEATFAMSLERLWRGLMAVVATPARRADDTYTCMANAFGDETRNTPAGKTAEDAAIVEGLEPRSYAGRLRPDAHAWAALTRFADWCREQGVTLVATFPSLVGFKRYEEAGHRAFFEGVVRQLEALGISVVGSPFAAMYDKADFYDSRYHLLAEPAARHSRRIAEEVRAALPSSP